MCLADAAQRNWPIGLVLLASGLLSACTGVPLTPSPGGPGGPPRQDPVTSITSVTTGAAAEHADELGRALEEAVATSGAPGAQAAVVFADGSTWTAAAGLSTAAEPLRPDHLMAIASVTKLYTGALVLALADAGRLSVDDQLDDWVDTVPHGEGVTLRHLLTHTSGLASDDVSFPPVCSPGTCYSYSNQAVGLLGRVVEEADGRTFASSLRARVLQPLDLGATFYPSQEPTAGDIAVGYSAGEARQADELNAVGEGSGWEQASGGLVATALDTARFTHQLLRGAVASPAALGQMLDPNATRGLPGTNECDAGEGMLIARRPSPRGEAWFHGGLTGYFRSWTEHFPNAGVSIAVITNADVPIHLFLEPLEGAALTGAPLGPASREGACNTDIALLDADGRLGLLTDDPSFDGFPSLSPDGARVAWIGNRDGANDVFVGAVDGSAVSNVTNDEAHDLFPRWSPDGTTIAYSSDADGDQEIYLMAPDGSDVRRLTDNEWDDMLPAWSPDGTRIAYTRVGDSQDIHVMLADGSADARLTDAPANEWWPAWSPDGGRIVYESGGALYVVAATGGADVRVPIERIRVTSFPAWAPGAEILFSSDVELYSVAADGSNLRRLTSTPTAEEAMAWGTGGSIVLQLSHWSGE